MKGCGVAMAGTISVKEKIFVKTVRGNFTIEVSVIVPVILTIFSIILTMLFYYHDKNVVAAITHETLVMGCSKEEITTEEVEQYLQTRIQNKLLLFAAVDPEAEIENDEITILCSAQQKRMSLRIKMSMKKTDPEEFIWNLQRIDNVIEGETK